MMYIRSLAVVAALAGMVFASTRLTAQDSAVREARDRAEIDALMWRYVRALDTRNADAYAAVYTVDGQFSAGGTPTKGREALRKMVADMNTRQAAAAAKGEAGPAMYHVTTNPYLEFVDNDHARLHAYWMTVFGAAGQATPPRVAAAGHSLDQLVRVNGQWLIQSRDVAPAD